MNLQSISKKRIVLIFFMYICTTVFAQSISDKQDIAVFSLSYYGWSVPEFLYNEIDSKIMETCIDLKRFNIIEMQYRLYAEDLEEFNQSIRRYRIEETAVPEEVLMGHEAFTRKDWEKAINSYYIIIPILNNYLIEKNTYYSDDNKIITKYHIKFEVDIHVYSAKTNSKIAFFTIKENKYGENFINIVKLATRIFAARFETKLRAIPDFTIRTGVIKAEKPKVYFELGNDFGVKKGDEYAVIGYDENNNEVEAGLLVVTNTQNDFSAARTLYAKNNIVIGDQLKEIPRFPFEVRLFPAIEFNPTIVQKASAFSDSMIMQFGMHISATRDFYRFRPCGSVEVGFAKKYNLTTGIPITYLAGMEIWNTQIGRLQILPTAQIFYTGLVSVNKKERWKSAELGTKVSVHLSYLFTRDIKFGADFGFKAGVDFADTKGVGLFRVILGLGLTFKI